jgi:cardiolipin synthase A/B
MIRVSGRVLVLLCLVSGGFGCSTVRWEKRIQHLVQTTYSVSDPQFANSVSHLLGPPLVEGNNITELINGDRIFPAMLDAIRGAEKTITFEQFIWSSGQVSTQFVAALAERARAGVKVHAIVDAIGSAKLRPWDRQLLKQAGVELVNYNQPVLKLWRLNHRTHRKIMVVDGKIGFTGGVCLTDAWMGDAEPDRWRDTHFRIEGPVVSQMQAVFVDNWLQMRSEILHGGEYFPQLKPAGTAKAQFFKSGPRDGAENARLAYLFSIGAARKHIRLAHAYFVPGDLLTKALLEARRRGVKVEVIVPSKIDNFAVKKAGRSRWGELLEAGVEFYEYEPTLYHCKTMIVDDVWVTTGSVNIDERSFRINDEANLNVLDRQFAAKLIRSFEADKGKSRRLAARDFKRRNWFSKLGDHFFGLFHSQL